MHVAQPTVGGVARYVSDLVADQLARGWSVTVACPLGGELAGRTGAAGARHAPWAASRTPGLNAAAETLRLAKLLKAERPDLVHLHSSKAGLAGRLALRARMPTLFQPHGWSFEAVDGVVRAAAAAWERRAARWVDVIVCVSEGEQKRGESVGVPGPWRVVPSGVDLSAYAEVPGEARTSLRTHLGLPDVPLVVCVGRLSRSKGQDFLIDAWPAVRERVPKAQLVIVGTGEDAAALERRAGEGVRLVGHRENVREWLGAADVVAVPSRWEGMSLTTLEAMACARSVVATDVPGAAEALGDESGAVVPPGDTEALAAALVERLLAPEKATAEGRAARRRAERLFDFCRTAATIAALYGEALAKRGSSRASSAP